MTLPEDKITANLRKIIENALVDSNTLEDKKVLQLELETLLCSLLKIDRIEIYLQEEKSITAAQLKEIEAKISRLINGEPLSYIIGYAQFRDITLKTGPGVLIPRPETEKIIDIAAKYVTESSYIIDVGTGTGAIALCMAKSFPSVEVIGVDISSVALEYANENKKINEIKNAIFKINDLCSGFSPASFDVIIANLPYISEEEYNQLPLSVLCFEPELALTPGRSGLELIERLVAQSRSVLKQGGYLILEIGYRQGNSVKTVLDNTEDFWSIEILSDYNNLDRFVVAKKKV